MLFRVLGPLEVRRPDGRAWELTAERHRMLLVLLLAHANDWVSVDDAVAVLWPDGAPAAAASNIRTYVHQLRQSLPRTQDGTPRINGRAGAYRLNVALTELDAAMFEDMTAQGRAALAAGDAAAAIERLDRGLALWRGEPFDALETGARTEERAEELEELRWLARDALADAQLAADRPADAVALLWPLSDLAPLREPTWLRLMVALDRDGHRDQALAVYEQFRAASAQGEEDEGSQELRRVHRILLDLDAGETQRIRPGSAGLPPLGTGGTAGTGSTAGTRGTKGTRGTTGTAASTGLAAADWAKQAQPERTKPAADAEPGNSVVPPLDNLRPHHRPSENLDPAGWVPSSRRRFRPAVVLAALVVVAAVVVGGWVVVNREGADSGNVNGGNDAGATSSQGQGTEAATPPRAAPPDGVSPRRAIPGMPGPDAKPALLFGVGDQADATLRAGLVDETGTRLLSTRFAGGTDDVTSLALWRDSVVPQAYGSGYAMHLVIADSSADTTIETPNGPACGRPYALSSEFLADVELLATAFAGPADAPPLLVTVFEGVQGYACVKGAYREDAATEAYYQALSDQYLMAREAFHRIAPNALVSLGWDSGQASHDNPATGGGLSMIRHFAELIRWSDFATASAAQPTGNVEHLRAAVRELGQYAPVLLSYGPSPAFGQDLPAMLADGVISELVGNGLFALTFYGDTATGAAASQVADAIARYGRPAR